MGCLGALTSGGERVALVRGANAAYPFRGCSGLASKQAKKADEAEDSRGTSGEVRLAAAATVSDQGIYIIWIDTAGVRDTGAHIAVVIGFAVTEDLADFFGTGLSRVERKFSTAAGLVDVQADRGGLAVGALRALLVGITAELLAPGAGMGRPAVRAVRTVLGFLFNGIGQCPGTEQQEDD